MWSPRWQKGARFPRGIIFWPILLNTVQAVATHVLQAQWPGALGTTRPGQPACAPAPLSPSAGGPASWSAVLQIRIRI